MQKVLTLLLLSMLLTAGVLVHHSPPPGAGASGGAGAPGVTGSPAAAAAKRMFRRDAGAFAAAAKRLHLTVINPLPEHPAGGDAAAALKDCRLAYKKIESFLSVFFPDVALGINGPPVREGEEPFMEYREPSGLQVVEALLSAKKPSPETGRRLVQETNLLEETAVMLPDLMYDFSPGEAAILQSIRLAVIRISTLGITGYDAPELKTGLAESAVVAAAIREQLQFFPGTATLALQSQDMAAALGAAADFDQFDRAGFIKQAVIPFAAGLNRYCVSRDIPMPATGLLRNGITDIYAAGALQPASVYPAGEALIVLGRRWFSDKTLSRGNSKSCASCHQPARAFTDNLPVSAALRAGASLTRNAPTLLYSAYQFRQFWDGKAAGLESQIFSVLHNPQEMDIDSVSADRRWSRDSLYRAMIGAAFPGPAKIPPSEMIGRAVGAYVTTLGAFNSSFDRFMQGNDSAIGAAARNGFNLFMGKARCATCHFAPLFNGTLPPEFGRTEFEVLGTTKGTDFRHPELSRDKGRYGAYPLPFNRYSFKTPTLRNAAKTAPYMHNGRFGNLEAVLTFYNNGGGAGMGLDVPGQTLSADSLHLNRQEMKDIIAFIYTLNDKPEGVKQ